MKRIVCEICDSMNVLKKDGVFECQDCGTQYSPEEAKLLLKEVSNTKTEVNVSDNKQVYNYMVLANEEIKSGKTEEALKYVNKILEVDPNNVFAWHLRACVEGNFSVSEARFERIKNAKQYFEKALENIDIEDEDLVHGQIISIRQTLSSGYKKLLQFILDDISANIVPDYRECIKAINTMKPLYIGDMNDLYFVLLKRYGDNSDNFEKKYGKTLTAGEENEITITPYQFKETYMKVLSRLVYYIINDRESNLLGKVISSCFQFLQFIVVYTDEPSLRLNALKFMKQALEDSELKIQAATGIKNCWKEYINDNLLNPIAIAEKQIEEKYKKDVEAYWKNNISRKQELERSIDELEDQLEAIEDNVDTCAEKRENDRLIAEINNKTREMNSLGFFKKAEKDKIQNEINILKQDKIQNDAALNEIIRKMKEEKQIINNKIDSFEMAISTAEGTVHKEDKSLEFYNAKPPVFNYSVDNTQIVETYKKEPKKASVIKEAIIGGVIAGPAGAVVGAIHAIDKNNR